MLEMFYHWVDETIYFLINLADPIPHTLPKEFIEDYIGRIKRRHAIRYLKHRIDNHLDVGNVTDEYVAKRVRGKRNRRQMWRLITLFKEAQDQDVKLYNRLRTRQED